MKAINKSAIKRLIAFFLCLSLAAPQIGIVSNVKADAGTINRLVKYMMSDARAMLELVNKARQEANEKSIDGITNRQPLTLDADLEKTAMLRVAEASFIIGHSRPDGTSCFTAYPKGGACGENLAWGSSSYVGTFNQWYSEKEDYLNKTGNTTGHYTNMISPSYKSIGIAGCKALGDKTMYGGYTWVQCFSTKEPNTTLLEACDGTVCAVLKAGSSYLAYNDSIPANTPLLSDVLEGKAVVKKTEQTTEAKDTQKNTTEAPNSNINNTKKKKPTKVKGLTIKSKTGGTLHIKWKKASRSKGYQGIIAKNKKFTKGRINFVSSGRNIKISGFGIKKKKTYYVKVRAYNYSKGKKQYGLWSKTAKIKVN